MNEYKIKYSFYSYLGRITHTEIFHADTAQEAVDDLRDYRHDVADRRFRVDVVWVLRDGCYIQTDNWE